ncbi:hypothetical protein IKE82_00140 [Candidatus Saccharibacteria bacterium]|nr:hypothetical protein [Candidatus Saccharibacteria bacterium]
MSDRMLRGLPLVKAKVEMIPGDKQAAEAKAKWDASKVMTDEEKREIRHEEDEEKELLLEREKENFTHIFALKCYNGWYKICDHSAIIVSTWLDGKLGKRYDRNDDAGYGKASTKAQYGVVSIPPTSVSYFIQGLVRNGIKISYETPWVLEFELGERITKEEMVRMLHEDELVIDRVNKLVMPKEVMPGIRSAVKKLLLHVHAEVRAQRDSVKDVFLNDVERLAVEMNMMVIAASRGGMGIEDCLVKLAQVIEVMYGNATTMMDMKLITAKQYKTFVDLIKHVQDEQSRMVRRRAIREAEVKNEKNKKIKSNAKDAAVAN